VNAVDSFDICRGDEYRQPARASIEGNRVDRVTHSLMESRLEAPPNEIRGDPRTLSLKHGFSKEEVIDQRGNAERDGQEK